MKRNFFSIIVSSIFLLGILFREELYYKFWLVSYLIMLVIIIGLLIVIFSNIKKDRTSMFIAITSLCVGLMVVLISETNLFKSKIIFEAVLVDDLSSLTLRLRENKDFELFPLTFIGYAKPFTGEYKLLGNKIIFLNRPFANDFIGDTVYIIDKKIILRFDLKGIPDTTFANYFRIDINELEK